MNAVTHRASGNAALGEALVLSDESAGSAVTVFPRRGAIVTSFRVGERELLYLDEATLQDPTKNVRGGIPVLFPTPGKLAGDAFSRDGVDGKLPQHGFARTSVWSVKGVGHDGPASVTLTLADDATTLREYPFPFRAELAYALRGGALRTTFLVENTGRAPLPYALGFHPYFAVGDKSRAGIDTAATRAFDNVDKVVKSFSGFDLTAPEVDVHLLDHGSTESALHVPGGAVRVRASSDFAIWVVWTLAGKDFVCLEPWTAPGNAMNTGERLTVLRPGETRTSWTEIAWEE